MTIPAHVDLDADPILIPHNGRLSWLFPSGRILPDIRGGDGDDDGEKKFTQEDVDRMITSRLKNVRAEPPADYAQLQAASAELATLKAKDNTDLENAKATIAALEGKVTAADAATATAKDVANQLKLENAIVAAATSHKALNPSQVAALVLLQKKDAVTIGDDGQVKGAEETVKAFLADAANSHHVGKTGRPAPDLGQGKGGETKGLGDAGRAEALKRFGTPAAATTGAQQ